MTDQSGIFKGKCILIADDSDSCFYLYEEILAGTGIHILRVKNGKDAIKTCMASDRVDIVIVDLVLPEINGVEVIKTLRQLKINVIIIAVTASVTDHSRSSCVQAGCDEFITKPINVKGFMDILIRYLNLDAV